VKKVKMDEVKQVENSTGYILGGVSPLGQKKRLPTIIDNSAQNFALVYISAGKRGLEVSLCPTDLATLCQASFAAISV
jgi:Cys-tRNA(Pro)/Cys-tRNA(Cys) deacylase